MKKLREIVIDEAVYLWRLKTAYTEVDPACREYRARVNLTVYLEGMKNTPLIVNFDVPDDPYLGTGITSSANDQNINRPAYVRMLIEEGIEKGWSPEEGGFELEGGIDILRKHGFNIIEIQQGAPQ